MTAHTSIHAAADELAAAITDAAPDYSDLVTARQQISQAKCLADLAALVIRIDGLTAIMAARAGRAGETPARFEELCRDELNIDGMHPAYREPRLSPKRRDELEAIREAEIAAAERMSRRARVADMEARMCRQGVAAALTRAAEARVELERGL